MPIIQTFFTYKKLNKISLKFDHFLFRMPKIIEIGWIGPVHKNAIQNITNAHINKFGPP